ncbi:hypothetical protein BDR04DRAFT_1122195 [Suillus decipiens]|nr:hypothetical protein BDR04DRAFT_1122195 [Suillus decipiens]
MHMCDKSCKQMQCHMGDKVIGWIEDKKKERLLIISILWRSQGLFSHRTVCYCIQDQHGHDYALKDCWVDETKKDHEERVLEIVQGIPNVVMLMDTWDVEYEGEPDSTLWIHKLHRTFSSSWCWTGFLGSLLGTFTFNSSLMNECWAGFLGSLLGMFMSDNSSLMDESGSGPPVNLSEGYSGATHTYVRHIYKLLISQADLESDM